MSDAAYEDDAVIIGKMLIGGAWTEGEAAGRIEVLNPATEKIVGTVPDGSAADAQAALEAAHAAQGAWARRPVIERARIIRRLCNLLEGHRDELARLLTAEQGKPFKQALSEVDGAIGFMEVAADNARRIEGDIVPSDAAGEDLMIRRYPVGVVVGLTAWNFPLALAGRKLGPALVAGNAIVLKAHELTPLTLIRFGELCLEAGIPEGVVNIVSGAGRIVGEALVRSSRSDLITLTGSVRAGREIFAAAADGLKILRLELGGKAPFIVMDDADLDLAVEAAISARFTNCGQICTCLERLYLHQGIRDAFLERFLEKVSHLKVGNPMEAVDLGPMASATEVAKVERMVSSALKAGAIRLDQPQRLEGPVFERGYWRGPAVLEIFDNAMDIMQQEIFGPVVPVMTVDSFEQAIMFSNQSQYGLSAYLHTRDIGRIMAFTQQADFGELYINRGGGEAFQGFHGGWKMSGLGGEDGKYGLDAYSRKKTVYLGRVRD